VIAGTGGRLEGDSLVGETHHEDGGIAPGYGSSDGFGTIHLYGKYEASGDTIAARIRHLCSQGNRWFCDEILEHCIVEWMHLTVKNKNKRMEHCSQVEKLGCTQQNNEAGRKLFAF